MPKLIDSVTAERVASRKGKCIGVVGSRRRDTTDDYEACVAAFERLYRDGDSIVSGGCERGGDAFAEMIARRKGCTITIHHAAWDKHGKAAGPIRNTLIAEQCDVLIALCAEDRSGGTEDTVAKVLKLKKKVVHA